MNQYHKIMEKFWLLMAIVSFVYAVYKSGQAGNFADTAIYFLFPLIAAVLFYLRYYVRKKAENESRED
jgi:hypothetical protein